MSVSFEQYQDFILDSGCSPDDALDDDQATVVSSKIQFVHSFSDWMVADFADDPNYPVTDRYALAEVLELSNGEVVVCEFRSAVLTNQKPYGVFTKLCK